MDIFELISSQDQFLIPQELLEAFRLFNSLFANHQATEPIPRKISWIPDHMNSVASHMAEHGLLNMAGLVELPGASTMGNLKFLLDRDMGRVVSFPEVEVMPDMGLGEVVDGPPPPLKRKCYECSPVFPVPAAKKVKDSRWSIVSSPQLLSKKGKERLYAEYAFYDNGVLSEKAEKILDAGYLGEYAATFLDNNLDLEAPVGNGLFAKDVLHYACLGILELAVPKRSMPSPQSASEFMPVEQLLVEMELENTTLGVADAAGVAVGPGQAYAIDVGNVSDAAEVGNIDGSDGSVDGEGLSAGVAAPAV
ncbi:hypothetical protein DCAR_0208420 [Daucus carota subsp. sativus]|uniref:Uncharacterized protein n=1 Tax=Daucus carota subsp. sativus TaxID=79200 RepID=A0A162AVY5_DAUCS|nr:hypothetical protein DCAR_0208420 [Daucus carota subsp. sativus]